MTTPLGRSRRMDGEVDVELGNCAHARQGREYGSNCRQCTHVEGSLGYGTGGCQTVDDDVQSTVQRTIVGRCLWW